MTEPEALTASGAAPTVETFTAPDPETGEQTGEESFTL